MLKSKGIITDLQREILLILSKIPDMEVIYLTGGTALADFFLGHRKSYDLYIFTVEKNLILEFSYEMEEELRKRFSCNVTRRFETFVEFEIKSQNETTKIHLAYDSPFRFEPPIDSELGIKVNGYKDIITDKLLAFFGRVEPRDAIDLFFILKTEDFWELTKFASQKDPGFDLYWLSVALNKTKSFPEDINKWPVDMLVEVDVKDLKNKFLNLASQIMDRIKEGKKDEY